MDENRIEILHMIEGARKARGLAVVIDVFRAFSLECFLYDLGAAGIRPVGTIEETFEWRKRLTGCLLCGERKGKMCEGFDLGNSPSAAKNMASKLSGKTIIHTTSAGTQGIVNASGADEIITGSLVNAAAIARYILAKDPERVSIVAMGNGGVKPAAEDELCAEYIRSMLVSGLEPAEGNGRAAMPDIDRRIAALRHHGGEHFFNPETQDVFPEPDFHLCVQRDIFDFIIRVEKDAQGFYTRKIGC